MPYNFPVGWVGWVLEWGDWEVDGGQVEEEEEEEEEEDEEVPSGAVLLGVKGGEAPCRAFLCVDITIFVLGVRLLQKSTLV